MKALINKHEKNIPGHDLKAILRWVQVKLPTVTASNIFTRELWDDVGVKRWDAATSGDAKAQCMLPWWKSIFEILKAQEKSHREKAGAGKETLLQ